MSKKISRSQVKVARNIGVMSRNQNSRHKHIPLQKVKFDPLNSRSSTLLFCPDDLPFDLENCSDEIKKKQYTELKEFGDEILEDGLINPITVFAQNDNFTLIAGHRRTISLMIAMLEKNYSEDEKLIPAIIKSEPTDQYKIARLQWNENDKRLNFVLAENINAIKRLIETHPTQNEKSKASTKLVQEVANLGETQARQYAKIINSIDELLWNAINSGEINNLEKAYYLCNLNDKNEISLAIEAIKEGKNLTEAKALATPTKANNKQVKKPKSQGRPATSINFGKTKHSDTALFIIDTLLNSPKLSGLKDKFFINKDRTNLTDLSNVFKHIVEHIEKQDK